MHIVYTCVYLPHSTYRQNVTHIQSYIFLAFELRYSWQLSMAGKME